MQTASHKARTLLTKQFPDEYAAIYVEIKNNNNKEDRVTNSYVQHHAKKELVRRYPKEYHRLYEKAVALGFPRVHQKGKNERIPD